ncbi:MAG: prolyl oligopeptidase family serine peptidase [Candidatus Hydrogenedentes bacterium]|nr:prolyl oligopeptidase family serine peptidase [Candidatus Hydrogenedentota bacterium]
MGMVLMATPVVSQVSSVHLYPDKSNLLVYADERGEMHLVKNAGDWGIRRAHILANMQLVMGELPDASRRVPLDLRVEKAVVRPKYIRKKVSFVVESGDRVPAYLLIPKKLVGNVPAMLCLHQTTRIGKGEPVGLGPKRSLHYAKELAERGYVTLAPDYPNFGEYSIDVSARGYASATMKGIWNHMRAVDLLQSLPEVDSERIGCIGHSLGGHNTLFVGVFDERIRIMVTNCGFNSFYKYYGGDLTGWSHQGYMPRIADVYGKDPARMPFDFTEVLAALAPRPVFISAPLRDANFEVSGVRDCVTAAQPVYDLLNAAENLVVLYPDCEHNFPRRVREAAYAFVDVRLKKTNHERLEPHE